MAYNSPQPPSDEEIAERLRQAADRSKFFVEATENSEVKERIREMEARVTEDPEPNPRRLPDDDPEFAARLKKLDDRAGTIRDRRESQKQQAEKTRKSDVENTQGLGAGLMIAYLFIGTPLLGLIVGLVVSRMTGMTIALPAGGFIGILVGCVWAFQVLGRANRRT